MKKQSSWRDGLSRDEARTENGLGIERDILGQEQLLKREIGKLSER
jgi:hypothetical protein